MENKMEKKDEKKLFKIKTRFVYTQKGLDRKESLPDTVEMRYLDLILRSVNKIMGKDNFCTRQGFYNERFGKEVSGLPESKRFVRIKNMETKKSVYRVWNGISTDEGGLGVETDGIIYIDKEAKQILTGDWKDDDDDQPVELEFKRVPGFLFYFFLETLLIKLLTQSRGFRLPWQSFRLHWQYLLFARLSLRGLAGRPALRALCPMERPFFPPLILEQCQILL